MQIPLIFMPWQWRQCRIVLWAAALSLLACGANCLAAGPLDRGEVPEPLQPWVDWVLMAQPMRNCPFLYNNFAQKRCAWPSELKLDLAASGGEFNASWQVYADSWVALPGSNLHWPSAVTVNAGPHAVVNRGGKPMIYLEPGHYTIAGRFRWNERPESIAIPADSGIVEVVVDGREVAFVRRDAKGRIWLAGTSRERIESAPENSVVLNVARRVSDLIPLQLLTRIEVDATGEQRELALGRVLLDGFIPVSIKSAIPARIEPGGDLVVQLRPGRHVIEVLARHEGPINELRLVSQAAPWPEREQWAFAAQSNLRTVEIEGGVAVDPRQTRLPQAWHALPVFELVANDALTIKEIRRGDPEPEPDSLSLSRELWLDFDGAAYTVQDRISGHLSRSWRLDSGHALELGQLAINAQPQFITRRDGSDLLGVEIRERHANVVAESRLLRSKEGFPASAWAHDFQSVATTLHLPPGWDVFSIGGVDNLPQTWLARWSLLDLFFVLVTAATVMRLWNWRAGALALLMLVASWHAPGAPQNLWLGLFILIALLRLVPAGRLRMALNIAQLGTVVALLFVAIPFIVSEMRLAAYPQLALPSSSYTNAPSRPQAGMIAEESMADFASAEVFEAEAPAADGMMLERRVAKNTMLSSQLSAPAPRASKRKSQPPPRAQKFAADPNALVQTGPGIPNWRWRSLNLSWNGPVDQQQQVSITYISPTMNTVLHVLRVALLVALLIYIAGSLRLAVQPRAANALLFACIGVLGFSSLSAVDVHAADFPDKTMLNELQQRLLAPPDCANQCADVNRLAVELRADVLLMRLEVHAERASAIPLPGQLEQWRPDKVAIDGVDASALAYDGARHLWLHVPAGIHQVTIAGRLAAVQSVQIALPLKPHAVTVKAQAWRIEGVRKDGLVDSQLTLTRIRNDKKTALAAPAFEASQLPPFVRHERHLRLGLDWTITNRLVRVVKGNTAAVVEVPLLANESVVSAGMEVVDGRVKVNVPPGVNAIVWESVLETSPSIELVAAEGASWSEAWFLQLGPMWHLTTSGIAPLHNPSGGSPREIRWRPWPGESVTLGVDKPLGASGQTMTIDSSTITIEPGKRATDTTLNLDLRSSKGGQYTLQLPPAVTLQSTSINNRSVPLRAEGRALTIPLTPGAQTVSLAWRASTGIETWFKTDIVELAIDSINHRINVSLGADRWILLTRGPRLGPAVLFWSLLAALLVVALGLARTNLAPLSTLQWLLLAIGLSQVPLALGAIVVAWLLTLGLRKRHGGEVTGWRFNVGQIVLALLSAAALMVLLEAIRHGLLGHPNMHVAGNGSNARALHWFADRIGADSPQAAVVSVPILFYRVLMLAWALWLALAVLNWLRWAWDCFGTGGFWHPWRKSKPATAER